MSGGFTRNAWHVGLGIVGGAALAGLALALGLMWFAIAQPLFMPPDPVKIVGVDPARLQTHVQVLANQMTPRDWGHPNNLDRAATYIQREFEIAGGRVREQSYEMNGQTYRNVVADFGPEGDKVVVVGAHYDAFGSLPGADDNASGVAGLIELGHLLNRASLATRVELVAFTLEEPITIDGPGLFRSSKGGSAVHVASLVEQGARVRMMLNLEMIGFYSDGKASQRYPADVLGLLYPSRGDFVAVVGKFGQGAAVRRVKAALRSASRLPVHSLSAPAFVEGVDWSDHANYWRLGYNAVMITDTARYRNPNYHTIRDTPVTLDYSRMAQVVSGVMAGVEAIAAGD